MGDQTDQIKHCINLIILTLPKPSKTLNSKWNWKFPWMWFYNILVIWTRYQQRQLVSDITRNEVICFTNIWSFDSNFYFFFRSFAFLGTVLKPCRPMVDPFLKKTAILKRRLQWEGLRCSFIGKVQLVEVQLVEVQPLVKSAISAFYFSASCPLIWRNVEG